MFIFGCPYLKYRSPALSFLIVHVICRESFLSGAMPIIGFLSILNPVRVSVHRPFSLIRQRFQRPVKSSICRQVEDHRELVAHKVEIVVMVLIGLRCFLLTCNGGGMRSWLSDESLSVRPKLRLGRDSISRIRTNPAMTYTTCYAQLFYNPNLSILSFSYLLSSPGHLNSNPPF